MTFSIPTHKCGLVIGRGESLRLCPFPAWLCTCQPFTNRGPTGGENVKAINQQTGAFMEISRQLPLNKDPNFKLSSGLTPADSIIEEKIEGPLFPVRPGPGGPGPAGPMGPFNPGPFNQGPPGAPPQ